MATGSQELRGRINLLGPDGEPIPSEFIAIARLDEDGKFAVANGSVRDMRERDRLERELRESETRFRQLVQTTPDVIYRSDADGNFLFMAEGVEALFGWTSTEVVGMSFAELTAEESLEEAMRNFEAQREEHDVVRRFRYMVKHRDGTVFPAAISSVAVWEDDKFAGVQGTARGLNEQERLERELAQSQERYRFLVENSPDVVFATDPDGHFTFISEAIETMTGYPPGELVGQHFSLLVQPESMAVAGDRWQKLVADPATQQVAELTLIGRDGRITPVEVHSIGITGPDGKFAGIHGSTRDIERAGTPPARDPRLRGALSLSRVVVAGPRLGDQRRRHPHLRQRHGRLDAWHDGARARRSPVLGGLRARGPARGRGPVQVAVAPSDLGPALAAALPARGRSRRPGRDQWHRHGVRREVRRRPWRGPRCQRPRPPRARPASPGGRAGGRRGTRAPGARAARLGHAGAVLDDPRLAVGRAVDGPRRRMRRGRR